jgi:hypothetical protein
MLINTDQPADKAVCMECVSKEQPISSAEPTQMTSSFPSEDTKNTEGCFSYYAVLVP